MRPEIELIALFVLLGGTVWYGFGFMRNGIQNVVEGIKIKNNVLVVKGIGKVVVIPLFFGFIWAVGLLFTKMCFFCQ